MAIGDLVLNLESWQAALAILGPLVVAGLTALNTSSKTKSVLAIVVLVLTTGVQAFITGGWTNDVFGNFVALAAVWQSMYMFWRGLGLTEYLQESVPALFKG